MVVYILSLLFISTVFCSEKYTLEWFAQTPYGIDQRINSIQTEANTIENSTRLLPFPLPNAAKEKFRTLETHERELNSLKKDKYNTYKIDRAFGAIQAAKSALVPFLDVIEF